MDTFKLKVKLGEAEFDGEGPETAVREQFAAFMEAVKSAAVPAPAKPTPPERRLPDAGDDDEGDATGSDADTFVPKPILDRVFSVKDNVISLRFLPKSEKREADSLLLIMLGYQLLANQDHLSAVMLGVAARQSGLTIDRVDRAMAPNDALVAKGGLRRGTRYSLNNQGILQAKKLLATAFG